MEKTVLTTNRRILGFGTGLMIDSLKIAFDAIQSSIVNRTSSIVLVLLVGMAPPAWAQNCVCSGFNSTRTNPNPEWSFTSGSHFARARANLADPAFFGPSGVVNRAVTVFAGTEQRPCPLLPGESSRAPRPPPTPAERADVVAAVRARMASC